MAAKQKAASGKARSRRNKVRGATEAMRTMDLSALGNCNPDLTLKSFMAGTNGGGSPENVPGFDMFRAVTAGFETRRIAGPTMLASRPDGGFFSQGAKLPASAAGWPASKPENVIGVDNRALVTNTSDVPWRCICHLEVEFESGPVGLGTGFFISADLIITAAHVLVDRRGPQGWGTPRLARRVRVIPGRNGTVAPYGYFVCDQFRIPPPWMDRKVPEKVAARHDYAAIVVPPDLKVQNENFGKRMGYFGLRAFADAELSAARLLFINNAGYPYEAEKPYGTLWYNAGRVGRIDDAFVEYLVDTEGGQSGSPVYFYDDAAAQRYVIAIHTTGDFVNRGLRITPEIFAVMKGWTGR